MIHSTASNLSHSENLVRCLMDPAAYPHPVGKLRLIETHISWVILTGDYAYKIKKPVNLGFLDFSDLETRRAYCEDELRLNRRTAPEIYVEVAPIGGTADKPVVGTSPAIEYAVCMRQFDPDECLDRRLDIGDLDMRDITAAAESVARFHADLDAADPGTAFGSSELTGRIIMENLAELRESLPVGLPARDSILNLFEWSEKTLTDLADTIDRRQRQGMVRECHGDLHLANMARIESKIVLFDCLEFAAGLRWTDVICDIAFVVMDLQARDQPALANCFLNEYLQMTGDYGGLAVLRLYVVYRALVRAKVAAIRWQQEGSPAEGNALDDLSRYTRLADRQIGQASKPVLAITFGFSGSGKTYTARKLRAQMQAIHVRSDIERKRLHGLPGDARSDLAVGAGYYRETATEETYERLLDVARIVLTCGHSVILDATFLDSRYRSAAQRLADELNVAFKIILCEVDEATLRRRIVRRAESRSDASEANLAVLDHQLRHFDPLTGAEQACSVKPT